MEWKDVLKKAEVEDALIQEAEAFRASAKKEPEYEDRIPVPEYMYYGKDVWNRALAALLAGENLLLAGPKATGKNVLAENLAYVLGRPEWDVSFHINVDASYLIGTDTYDGDRVKFRPGPVYQCAVHGGFGILDEINMAKNEALAVLHATLDFRHIIDVPGYDKIAVDPACRFIATMNYGYAGTRDLNEALCSRFAVLDMPVISEENLKHLISDKFSDIRPEMRDQFAALFYDLQKKAEHADISERSVDLRGLMDSIRLIQHGLKSGEALDMCISNKSFDPYERSLVQDTIHARIPQDLTRENVFGK